MKRAPVSRQVSTKSRVQPARSQILINKTASFSLNQQHQFSTSGLVRFAHAAAPVSHSVPASSAQTLAISRARDALRSTEKELQTYLRTELKNYGVDADAIFVQDLTVEPSFQQLLKDPESNPWRAVKDALQTAENFKNEDVSKIQAEISRLNSVIAQLKDQVAKAPKDTPESLQKKQKSQEFWKKWGLGFLGNSTPTQAQLIHALGENVLSKREMERLAKEKQGGAAVDRKSAIKSIESYLDTAGDIHAIYQIPSHWVDVQFFVMMAKVGSLLEQYKVPKDKEQEFINKFMISPGYPTADFVYPPATPEHTFEEVVLVKTNRPANADIH